MSSQRAPVHSVKWAASLWYVWESSQIDAFIVHSSHPLEKLISQVETLKQLNKLCCVSQIENGKLSDHENSSTMEHLRLLLTMVLSVTRARTEAPGPGEWQEDSGLSLYRAPEEADALGAGAAASAQSVDLEKKASLKGFDGLCCS